MRIILLIALIGSVFLQAGCSNAEKYAANQSASSSWLKATAGTSRVSIDGTWQSLEFGWGGDGRFVQTGNQITGALGNYSVRGVINGSTVYLTFDSNGWTYYTCVLKKNGNMLAGFYSSSVPFSSQNQGVLTLRKIAD
jgi:hypothetical protein